MKITLLGTGGPRPDPYREGPSSVVSIGDENILIDAGRGTSSRLVQAGTPITEVGYVFITHHHFDHTAGLADMLFAAWNKARNKTIKVFGPKGTSEMLGHLFNAYSARARVFIPLAIGVIAAIRNRLGVIILI